MVADGRADWLGWVELRKEPLSDVSIRNTGRVLKDLAADVQGIVEAESRTASIVLPTPGGPIRSTLECSSTKRSVASSETSLRSSAGWAMREFGPGWETTAVGSPTPPQP